MFGARLFQPVESEYRLRMTSHDLMGEATYPNGKKAAVHIHAALNKTFWEAVTNAAEIDV
jgi:hypothetical protein